MNVDMNHYKTLKVTLLDNGILKIVLSRPDVLNALNSEMLSEFARLFTYAKSEPSVRALLITGEGKAFCAGADIKQLCDLDTITGEGFALEGQRIFRLLETLGKPSLAAINGYAFGGGCELAMAATIRIASDKAQFGQPEIKLGVIPGYAGTQRLARLVGKGRALELCLTGRFISADEALNWGLVSEIVPGTVMETRTVEILSGLVQMAPIAIDSIMRVIDQGYDITLEDAMRLEALYFGRVCATADKTEGVNAFLDKRKPVFQGN